MDPALALPSYRVYRGSLLALLVGSIVAVWLLVLPPAAADQDGPPAAIADIVGRTATPTAAETPVPTEVGDSPDATPTPEPIDTPVPTPTQMPEPEQRTYIVQSGDSLFLIAGQFAPPGVDPADFANSIQQANGITDPSALQVGQELIIPNE
jgi:Tfp pilus assembly protein FimV